MTRRDAAKPQPSKRKPTHVHARQRQARCVCTAPTCRTRASRRSAPRRA
jgi:hypothetical protein